MTLKNNRAPLLCHFKLCASFLNHQSLQTGVTVRKHPIRVKISNFWSSETLKFDWWPWKTNNRPLLLCYFKLCASFHCHMWIQTGVTVRKQLNWVLTSVILTCDLWPWPFAWTSLLSKVIIPENFMMIRWDRLTDGQRCSKQLKIPDFPQNSIFSWPSIKILWLSHDFLSGLEFLWLSPYYAEHLENG